MSTEVEWFEEWFDTPYYHMLYSKHDLTEAMNFTSNLISKIKISKEACILDLGCGRGRHSIYLNKRGYKVKGIDLSCKSIDLAKQFERSGLSFSQGDMRDSFGSKEYDLILNLFTSFGYFSSPEEHLPVLKNVYEALKPGGLFVLDFFNSEVIQKDEGKHHIEIEGIVFSFTKHFQEDRVIKKIHIQDGGKEYHFQEEVLTLSPAELRKLLESTGLEVVSSFGSYLLKSFDPEESERIILCARKA